MTDAPLSPPPEWQPGSPESDEWEKIAAAPSGHTRLRTVDPDSPVHLAELDRHRALLALLEHAGDGPDALSGTGVLYGPDVSQYQAKPDWSKVRAAGCVIGGYKVSEGRTFDDPSRAWNQAHVRAAGLVPLEYHYLYYSTEYSGNPSLWAAQADWFVRNAGRDAIHILDVEDVAATGAHLGVREWVARYRQLLPGHPIGVYTNRALWENRSRMPYDPAGIFDFVWHAGVGNGYYTSATGTIQAQWSAQSGLVNSLAGVGYPTARLWQITDHAAVPGVVASFCDGNVFQGTLDQLKALATGTTTEDDMPLTPDDIAKVAAAVWGFQVGEEKDPNGHAVTQAIAQQRNYNRLADVQAKATALAAALAKVLAQTDTLEASETAQTTALAAFNADALAAAIAAKLGGSADTAQIKQALTDALAEQLPGVHLAVD
jgi:hypothetical protein